MTSIKWAIVIWHFLFFINNFEQTKAIDCKYTGQTKDAKLKCANESGLYELYNGKRNLTIREQELANVVFQTAIGCSLEELNWIDEDHIANKEIVVNSLRQDFIIEDDANAEQLKESVLKDISTCFDIYDKTKAEVGALFTCTRKPILEVCGQEPHL